tara:strand:- start:74 stop:772 length:699 start_codon:yes stop_codon:yes gene_type:complete
MTINYNRQRFFNYKNLWHTKEDGNQMPFDPDVYPDGYAQFRSDKPEQWMVKWNVKFLKAKQEQVDNQYDFYDDPNEVFVSGMNYTLLTSKVYYIKPGVHCVGLEIYGIDGIYNPEFFTTLLSKFRANNPQINLLKNPPPEMPEYGTPEYRTLFKETGGNCIISLPSTDPNVDNATIPMKFFDYANHILVTRKPEELIGWGQVSVKPKPKPKPKPSPAIDYFNANNSVKKRVR